MAQTPQERKAAQRANAKQVQSGSLPQPMNRSGFEAKAANSAPFVSRAKPKALGSPNLSGPQFAKSTPRATPVGNSQSMLPGGFGSSKAPTNRAPAPMYSSMHPGGGAASVNRGVATPQQPNTPMTMGKTLSASPVKAKKQGFGSKVLGGLKTAVLSAAQHGKGSVTQTTAPKGGGKAKTPQLKPSKHSGQLSQHLQGAASA